MTGARKPSPPHGAGVVPREVAFEAAGIAITAYLFVPPGTGPFACLVNNHGSHLPPGTAQVSRPQLAALALGWGYAFCFPHRRGYGSSPGVPVNDAIPAPLGSEDYDEQIVRRLDDECDDVLSAVAGLRDYPDIDSERIAVMGSSRGGIVSLLAAARDERLRCAINFCGGARQWAGHPRLRRKMLDAAGALAAPIFLAQAENDLDTAATVELAAELARLGKPHECRIYPPWGFTPSEGHLFETHGSLIWGDDVRQFLARNLA